MQAARAHGQRRRLHARRLPERRPSRLRAERQPCFRCSSARLPRSSGTAAFTCTGAPAHSLCTVNPVNAAAGRNSVRHSHRADRPGRGGVAPAPCSGTKNSCPCWRCCCRLASACAAAALAGMPAAAIFLLACQGCGAGREIPAHGYRYRVYTDALGHLQPHRHRRRRRGDAHRRPYLMVQVK